MFSKPRRILLAAIAVGFLVCSVTAAGGDDTGRFKVVSATKGEIILLDTVTGDLFVAGPSDVKDYKLRPKGDTPVAKGPAVGLDAIAKGGGARFGDWVIWRYDIGDPAIFMIHQKSGYLMYLPWISNGWINFRTGGGAWFVLFSFGKPEKQPREELDYKPFLAKKPPAETLAPGTYKFQKWTVKVTETEMHFHSADFGDRMVFSTTSPVFTHNGRRLGE